MIAYENWVKTQEELKYKHAIEEENKYENFYITGEDLEDAFIAGMRFHEELLKKEKE